MPKLKSHSGAKKRFKVTAKGKLKYKKAGLRLVQSPEAVSRHHHDYTPKSMWRRARSNGRSAAILIEKQPDLRRRLMDDFYNISRRRRILNAMFCLLNLQMEKFWAEVERVIYLRSLEQGIEKRKR